MTPCPLMDATIPVEGLSDEEFKECSLAMQLDAFLQPSPEHVILGGHPQAPFPDTINVGNGWSPVASRNQPCPCGSGKKYKRCCLQ